MLKSPWCLSESSDCSQPPLYSNKNPLNIRDQHIMLEALIKFLLRSPVASTIKHGKIREQHKFVTVRKFLKNLCSTSSSRLTELHLNPDKTRLITCFHIPLKAVGVITIILSSWNSFAMAEARLVCWNHDFYNQVSQIQISVLKSDAPSHHPQKSGTASCLFKQEQRSRTWILTILHLSLETKDLYPAQCRWQDHHNLQL